MISHTVLPRRSVPRTGLVSISVDGVDLQGTVFDGRTDNDDVVDDYDDDDENNDECTREDPAGVDGAGRPVRSTHPPNRLLAASGRSGGCCGDFPRFWASAATELRQDLRVDPRDGAPPAYATV